MNLIKEAREAALKAEWSKKIQINYLTDDLANAFGQFSVSCSRTDMKWLVASWSRVILALNELPVTTPPSKTTLTDAG